MQKVNQKILKSHRLLDLKTKNGMCGCATRHFFKISLTESGCRTRENKWSRRIFLSIHWITFHDSAAHLADVFNCRLYQPDSDALMSKFFRHKKTRDGPNLLIINRFKRARMRQLFVSAARLTATQPATSPCQ